MLLSLLLDLPIPYLPTCQVGRCTPELGGKLQLSVGEETETAIGPMFPCRLTHGFSSRNPAQGFHGTSLPVFRRARGREQMQQTQQR